jgi:radical SAM superfamily enzyme YgiQ (UPF0313 family)
MKSNVDLVLINPLARSQAYQVLGNEMAAIEPPVWLGLIATFIRKKGFSVHVIEAEAEGWGPDEVARQVSELKPHLAAVVVYGHHPSASTQNMPASGAVCSSIRKLTPHIKTALVGGHVAALPERSLREEEVDFICSGEGVYTIAQLLEVLKSGSTDFAKVSGLWYWEGKEIRSSVAPALVRDLDNEMPGIAWDLFPMKKYRAHNWHSFDGLQRAPYAAIYTTLGCPFHCSFCCIQAPFKEGEKALGYKEWTNSYRFWSPKVVLDEIETLVNKYGVRNIKFADELFVANRSHVFGICDGIIERGLKVNIWAYARVDSIKDGMLEKLKSAGVNWLALGIEAGSARVRNEVDKKIDQNDIFKIVKQIQDAGIYVIGNYIFGLPEDDLASMQETLDLAIELNCEFANLYSAMAYPGSQLYRQAIQDGLSLPEKWSGYSQHSFDTLPLPTKYISGPEVLAFRDNAFQVYFSSPKYLDMIQKKFGRETVDHIREMTRHRLERKYVKTSPVSA